MFVALVRIEKQLTTHAFASANMFSQKLIHLLVVKFKHIQIILSRAPISQLFTFNFALTLIVHTVEFVVCLGYENILLNEKTVLPISTTLLRQFEHQAFN